MNDISSRDDIIDVRDVIARVEELREELKPWAAGWNMPGYMPDREPGAFSTWEEARDSLIEDMERAADETDDETEAAELREWVAAVSTATENAPWGATVGAYHWWITTADTDPDDAEELTLLEGFLKQMAGYGGDEQWDGEWYPVTLIRDSYFEEYAEQLAEDCGTIAKDAEWPARHIDWEAAAEELRHDYTAFEFDGVTYWGR